MRTFAKKPRATQQTVSAKPTKPSRAHFGQHREVNSILHLQRTIGNQAVQRMLQTHAEKPVAGLTDTASPCLVHDFSRIPIHPRAAGALQTKLAINKPGDQYEQEADRVAQQVMRLPDSRLQRACACGGGCPKCRAERPGQDHEPSHTSWGQSSSAEVTGATPVVREDLHSGGYPLGPAVRASMESRFGHSFSRIRIHTDAAAAEHADSLHARAFTTGSHIVFARGQYDPVSAGGQRLLAHELTHVIQQSRGGSIVPTLQRACGKAVRADEECTAQGGDVPDFGRSSNDLYLFKVGCDEFQPGEEARLTDYVQSLTFSPGEELHVHGFASEEGGAAFNEQLSCARALYARKVVRGALTTGSALPTIYVFQHGATLGERLTRRSIVLDRPTTLESEVPQPEAEPEQATCTPKPGIRNSECDAYAKESWWLPEAYVHNAICACQETPNVPTANCVRKFLQDRLGQVDRETKVEASHWLGALMGRRVSKDEYINFVQLKLTPIIYKDHVDAYRDCCCPSGPAPLAAWRGVTTFALPCAGVGEAIRRFGSCHGTPGKW